MADAEARITLLFKEIDSEFRQVDKIHDLDAADSKLKGIIEKIKDAKGLIREYEREGIIDGMDKEDVRAGKARMVNQINKYVSQKKDVSNRIRAKREAVQPQATSTIYNEEVEPGPSRDSVKIQQRQRQQQMTNQEIVSEGHKKMDEIDRELAQGVRVVTETEEMAVKTAAQLKEQTDQMNRVIDDLNEIEFTMQRASKVIRDITRGLLTDKCIMFLLFIVVGGICVAIGLKVAGVGGDDINLPGPDDNQRDEPDGGASNRKLLANTFLSLIPHRSR